MPHPTAFGGSSHPCAHERVFIRNPSGWTGYGTKIAVNFLDGEPISASIILDRGHQTVIPLDWLTSHGAVQPSAKIIIGPWRRPLAGSDWTVQEAG